MRCRTDWRDQTQIHSNADTPLLQLHRKRQLFFSGCANINHKNRFSISVLPSGRTVFSQDVSFSALGSREQQEVEEMDSEKPESLVREEDSESETSGWIDEAGAMSARD